MIMTREEYASRLLPGITKTIEDYEKIYPKRQLKEGAIVTRYGKTNGRSFLFKN